MKLLPSLAHRRSPDDEDRPKGHLSHPLRPRLIHPRPGAEEAPDPRTRITERLVIRHPITITHGRFPIE